MSRLIRMDQHRPHDARGVDAPTIPRRSRPPSRPSARSSTAATSPWCSTGEGQAEQVRELPVDAELVIMRLPIAGG